jgi:hypothetical protein
MIGLRYRDGLEDDAVVWAAGLAESAREGKNCRGQTKPGLCHDLNPIPTDHTSPYHNKSLAGHR